LDSSGGNDGHEIVSNGRKGKEQQLVNRKMALAGEVEGLYSGK